MCGIAGMVVPSGRGDRVESALGAMCDAIVHRGPDDVGTFVEREDSWPRQGDAVVALGMRRLSIIDTEGGHQPISNEDGSVVVVYNGELYNFPELRRGLEARGHVFRTSSDTEVLVHLYEEKGPELVDDLAGMYAFALYDRNAERLVLARDRLGIKPLYIMAQGGTVLFGSELKCIVAASAVHPAGFTLDVDPDALHSLLTLSYIPSPGCIWRGVTKLRPGHRAVVNVRTGEVRTERTWSLESARSHGLTDYDEATEALDALLRQTVNAHLLSDVPVGAFVSGGVDSSLVAAYASEGLGSRLQTFSIGFTEPLYDETDDALFVVRQLQTQHTLWHATWENLYRAMPRIFSAMDEPFGDSSMLPTYLASELAGSRLKVVLSGDGGDEVFAGYDKHLIEYFKARLARVPGPVVEQTRRALRGLPKGGKNRLQEFVRRAEKATRGLGESPQQSYLEMVKLADLSLIDSLLVNPGTFTPTAEAMVAAWEAPEDATSLQRTQYTDLHFGLPGDMLTKVDRMSMLNSLEVRVPFLDHRVVEFGYHLPDAHKLEGRTTKRILKRLFCKRFGLERYTKAKQGFRVPVEVWLGDRLRPLIDHLFAPERLRQQGIFDPATIGGAQAHRLAATAPYVMWNAMMFQIAWSLQVEGDRSCLDRLS